MEVKEEILLIILCTFALASCVVSVRMTFAVHSGVIRVPQDYPTVREAINAANPGDTILVSSGIYNEGGLLINKTLTIAGEDVETTIIGAEGCPEIFILENASNVIISNFTVRYGEIGVFLIFSENCVITSNKMIKDIAGVKALNSGGNRIQNNIFEGWKYGVLLDHSHNNIVTNNEAYSMDYYGIYTFCSNNNNISHNKIYSCQAGIFLSASQGNFLKKNVLSLNEVGGVHLLGARECHIIGNMIMKNWHGINLYGNCYEVVIYHNNFIDNMLHFDGDPSPHKWDNGAEGNYWDDYNGTDLNGDGIGDTELPWLGVDYYPLMNPYWNPADVDHDLDVDLYDAVRVLVAYGSKLGHENFNPHCDITEPYGIIDLYDVMTVLVNYGKRYDV